MMDRIYASRFRIERCTVKQALGLLCLLAGRGEFFWSAVSNAQLVAGRWGGGGGMAG
jgi:hypothetical protein